MKKAFILFLIMTVITTLKSQDKAAENTIKRTIEQFFVHMSAHDSASIRTLCMPDLLLKSLTIKDGETVPSQVTLQGFLNSIGTKREGVSIEERILSYDIKMDGPMAIVWTPYEFYVNDKKSHHGVNVFTMAYLNDSWKILNISDTRYR